MRISQITTQLDVEDLNSILQDFLPDSKIRITEISRDGIRGTIELLVWSINFTARPSSSSGDELSIDIGAHKLVPIPAGVVNWRLKEAVRDAPAGVDVIRQALTVHLPSLLGPFDVAMSIRELRVYDGYLRLSVEGVQLPKLTQLMKKAGSK